MKLLKKVDWSQIAKVFLSIATVLVFVALLAGVYLLGFTDGMAASKDDYEGLIASLLSKKRSVTVIIPSPTPVPTPIETTMPVKKYDWSGPDLWEAVNKRRVDLGVNPLKQKDELCTIASIRLNEILALGKLDGHEGFSSLPERRPDLKWIFEKYVIAEFLISGAESAQEAVSLWENTLGHKKLVSGGEYVWGCTYAQNSFGVAIAAYE
jgi:hypothetical protein